jgi:DNA-binding HxlR family transcriptional regulator
MSATNLGVPAPLAASVTPGPLETCPVREVLDRVGDKWSVLLVVLLGERSHRFSELHRAIEGISQRMLTLTLRVLERDGLVSRTVHPTVPPKVEYALTELGRTLLVPLSALADWAQTHREDILAARARYDARAQ